MVFLYRYISMIDRHKCLTYIKKIMQISNCILTQNYKWVSQNETSPLDKIQIPFLINSHNQAGKKMDATSPPGDPHMQQKQRGMLSFTCAVCLQVYHKEQAKPLNHPAFCGPYSCEGTGLGTYGCPHIYSPALLFSRELITRWRDPEEKQWELKHKRQWVAGHAKYGHSIVVYFC